MLLAMTDAAQEYKSLHAKNSGLTMVKPGELIDIVEVTPLTLADRRIYNLLIRNAWETISRPVEHRIPKKELRGHNDNDNVRVGQSIERLMGAIVKVRILRGVTPATRRIPILGVNDEEDPHDGILHYTFPAELREIITESNVFARLRVDIMFALTSKYALALYEMVQKRGNLQYRQEDEFSINELRSLLGVPKGKLKRFADLHKYALQPAVQEVNALSDYFVRFDQVKEGRWVTALRLKWFAKDTNGKLEAYHELQLSKTGRKARIAGRVDQVA